jgi:predicted Rossmann fold flavoprotein
LKDLAIIGGGAAGLVAAITAARRGLEVDIYEQNNTTGKKILASGNGRCNISNTTLSSNDYFGNHPAFVKAALNAFGFHELQRFFEEIGLMLDIKEDGRVYPLANEAKSVLNALTQTAQSLNITTITSKKITQVKKNDHFLVDNQPYKKLLIATGSEAAPQLGADDSGYALAKSFGHRLIPTYPALVGLELASTYPKFMSGSKTAARVTLYVNRKIKAQTSGDILFTKYGLSGFAILDISQQAAQSLDNEAMLGLDLLPTYERSALTHKLQKLLQLDRDILSLLTGFIPTKIAVVLLKSLNIDPDQKALNPKQLRLIVNTLQDWRFPITSTHGFKHAEVSGGGVDTQSVNPKTYESHIVPNLYFAGEILDIVGKRGGYNLHFAFSSGYIAGNRM